MFSSLFLILCIFGPAALSVVIAPVRERLPLFMLVATAGVFFMFLVYFVNEEIPFASGGDDSAYFRASERTFDELSDWFDFAQFKDSHEQSGYPLLLSWVHQFSGGSLLHRKALNVAFFLLIAQVWAAIGYAVGGRRVAMTFATAIVLTAPLWYYFLFLLKDMAIVFLQSVMLGGVVLASKRGRRITGYAVLALSTLAILPFRSLLAIVNAVTIGIGAFVGAGGRGAAMGRVAGVFVAALLIVGILLVGTQRDMLASFGILGGDRSLDADSIEMNIDVRERARVMFETNPLKFPIVYLVGEVAAFNPNAWDGSPSHLLRSVLVVPWIYVGLPFFLLGSWTIIKNARSLLAPPPAIGRPGGGVGWDGRHFLTFLAFVGLYAVVSWLSGDTTRWRMAAFPPMAAISALAWMITAPGKRVTILFFWSASVTTFVVLYYILLK